MRYAIEHPGEVTRNLHASEVGWRETSRCQLIKQELEETGIAFVDQRHIGIDVAQTLCSRQATEACTNDNDVWTPHPSHWPVQPPSTGNATPVIERAPSLHRKAQTAPSSSTVTKRLVG